MKSISLLPLAALVVLANAACSSTSQDNNAESSSDDLKAKHVVGKLNQVNLTADLASAGAAVTDPNLQNPWGVAFNTKGGAWISDNGTGKTTVYDATGALQLTVDLPGAGGAASDPSGQVLNPDTTAFGGDLFIFASEDGTISAWQPKPGASVKIDNSAAGANYKGITIAKASDGERLYATNFGTTKVDVFDSNYAPLAVSGGFEDSQIPAGYGPFNIRSFNDDVLVVTYAKQDKAHHDDVKGSGFGFVDAFDLDGNLLGRLVSHSALSSPWGIAIAPDSYGDIAGDLLISNFGDGRINAYAITSDAYGNLHARLDGALGDASGKAISIEGLWSINFGPGVGGADADQLYFTAGPDDEAHGLFGRLEIAK
jgi:uncharacterized protein (TIGR03118 family)